MSAAQAAEAMCAGVAAAGIDATCVAMPIADGGEGTVDAVVDALGGRRIEVPTRDVFGKPRQAILGLLPDDRAVIEVAQAVGLGLVPFAERNLLHATSLGVADLVLAAFDSGARELVIGLGGTGTNDGGAGLLVGLGARLLDDAGNDVPPEPAELARVAVIDLTGLDPRWSTASVTLACDVTSPLLGPDGATAVFGPQKLGPQKLGARPREGELDLLEAALTQFATALERATGRSVRELPGAGAAGGLGAAFLALGAVRRDGAATVIETVGLAAAVATADLVLTGEGSLDRQTLTGKAPAAVAALAQRHGVPVIAFGGRIDPTARAELDSMFTSLVPLTDEPLPLPEALASGPANLRAAVARTVRQLAAPT